MVKSQYTGAGCRKNAPDTPGLSNTQKHDAREVEGTKEVQGVHWLQKEQEAKEMKEDHPVLTDVTGGEAGLEGAGGAGGTGDHRGEGGAGDAGGAGGKGDEGSAVNTAMLKITMMGRGG